MKLLILTQKVNITDPVLGFFHKWIEEFSKKFEKVSVICLEKGEFELPKNVSVYSLGKEAGQSKIKYLKNFYNLILGLHKEYDTVFVHMNPEYIVLGGIFWKILDKKIALWYTHRASNLKLWLAAKLADVIFTSSKYSFTLRSCKLRVLGHGIDTDLFFTKNVLNHKNTNNKLILHVGRITEIKNCRTLIEMLNFAKKIGNENWRLKFIGEAISESDKIYKDNLLKLIKDYKLEHRVEFSGALPQKEIANLYATASASVNLAPTGGVDKVVLESLSIGTPVFASNLAFEEIFGEYKYIFMFNLKDPKDLAEKLTNYFNLPKDKQEIVMKKMSDKIVNNFSVSAVINKISLNLYEASR